MFKEELLVFFVIHPDENISLWAEQKPLAHYSWYFQLYIEAFCCVLYATNNLFVVF
jgi:hypothetical protein